MIALAYALIVVLTAIWLGRHYRGRTVEGLIRNPPAGSDLNAIVSQLSYLEHELLKHRVPVVQSLLHKRLWNDDDHDLLGRTVGTGDASMRAEMQRYLDGIQRGAGRVLVNFERDRAFTQAIHAVDSIQKAGERWLRSAEPGGPDERERRSVEEACAWLSGSFRHYLIELNRSVFRCRITPERLRRSATRGLSEAGRQVDLTIAEPPDGCVASVLPTDLDIAVRNLSRNAAQVTVPGSGEGDKTKGPAVYVDVDEQLEATGEESVLIRIHDRSPRRLSSDQIYGREARRGLGLVTSALGRHGGAVRCVDSARDSFEKAMEIRLARSLHDPDPAAMAIGRPGFGAIARPIVAVVAHIALLTLVVVPWLAPHPLVAASIIVPAGCVAVTSADDLGVALTCDAVDDEGALRRAPIAIRFDGLAGDPGSLSLGGDPCIAVTERGTADLAVDVGGCFDQGRLAPSVRARFGSLWRRGAFEVRVDLVPSSARLLQAGRVALNRGELDRVRTVTDQLLGADQVGLSVTDEAEANWLRAMADVEAVARARLAGDDLPEPAVLCSRLHDIQRRAQRLLGEGSTDSDATPHEVDRARLLLAEATLWVTASAEGALGLLDPLLEGTPSLNATAPTQAARLLGAVLLSEGVAGSLRDPRALIDDLWSGYARPAATAAGREAPLTVQLAGLSLDESGFGGIPVPELVCAFRSRYPDVRLPPALVVTLAGPCGRRPPHREVDAWLAAVGRFVRDGPRPVACP